MLAIRLFLFVYFRFFIYMLYIYSLSCLCALRLLYVRKCSSSDYLCPLENRLRSFPLITFHASITNIYIHLFTLAYIY